MQHRADLGRFAAELRGLADAFETYRVQWGDWSAATDAERRTPRGIESARAQRMADRRNGQNNAPPS
jgi:hypothetical protein